MGNAPAASRHIPDPNAAAIYARLAAIEERLDEIIRRLDEMKSLLKVLDDIHPNCQRAED